MSNQHQDFKDRIKDTTTHDMAKRFFEIKKISYCEYGIQQVKVFGKEGTYGLPKQVLKAPDFITLTKDAEKFIEVKGCSRFLNLKVNDIKYYHFWNSAFNMELLILAIDHSNNDVYTIPLDDLTGILIHQKLEPKPYENDGKLRYEIDLRDLEMYKQVIT